MEKEFILSYVGRTGLSNYWAKSDPVTYLAEQLVKRNMSGAEAPDRRTYENDESATGRALVLTKEDFEITSRGPNKLEIKSKDIKGIERGRKLIIGITHTHGFRDYLLDEIQEGVKI